MNLLGSGLLADLCEVFLVNFAVHADRLRPWIPAALELEQHGDCGFVSAVVARVEAMRPTMVPAALGRTFDAVVYRVPVRYRTIRGRTVRGVCFLHSDVSDWLLGVDTFWRRLFHCSVTQVVLKRGPKSTRFRVFSPTHPEVRVSAEFDHSRSTRQLPASSRFASLAEAQRALVELYAAFHVDERGTVSIVPIARAPWNVAVVPARRAEFDLLAKLAPFDEPVEGLANPVTLDSVFYVPRVPYHWYPPVTGFSPPTPALRWRRA